MVFVVRAVRRSQIEARPIVNVLRGQRGIIVDERLRRAIAGGVLINALQVASLSRVLAPPKKSVGIEHEHRVSAKCAAIEVTRHADRRDPVPRCRIRQRVPRRRSGIAPGRNRFAGCGRVGSIAVAVVIGVRGGEARGLEGLVADHAVVTFGIHPGGLELKSLPLRDNGAADR